MPKQDTPEEIEQAIADLGAWLVEREIDAKTGNATAALRAAIARQKREEPKGLKRSLSK